MGTICYTTKFREKSSMQRIFGGEILRNFWRNRNRCRVSERPPPGSAAAGSPGDEESWTIHRWIARRSSLLRPLGARWKAEGCGSYQNPERPCETSAWTSRVRGQDRARIEGSTLGCWSTSSRQIAPNVRDPWIFVLEPASCPPEGLMVPMRERCQKCHGWHIRRAMRLPSQCFR